MELDNGFCGGNAESSIFFMIGFQCQMRMVCLREKRSNAVVQLVHEGLINVGPTSY